MRDVDMEAFLEIEAALLRYAYVLTGSRHDAQDLVQETYLKLLQRRNGHPVEAIGAYARRVILNSYRSRLRRPKNAAVSEESASP